MKDLGVMKYFVGIEVEEGKEPRTVQLHQSAYVEKMLFQYSMQECRPVSPPMVQSDKICKRGDHQELSLEGRSLYRSMVGSVMYLMCCSRPDISLYCGHTV